MKELLYKNYNINNNEKITILDSNEFLCKKLFNLHSNNNEVIVSYNHIKSLGTSTKIKNYLLKLIINSNEVIVFHNVLSELDYKDKQIIIESLKKYNKIFINITNDVEECLYFDRVIIIYNNKVICDGKTINVLNEEKLLKRLGYGLPFIIELNKYLMDYNIINKYYLDNEKLASVIWK